MTAEAAVQAPDLPKHLAANPRLSRWLAVEPDGVVGLRVGKVELGQGIATALAQIAADELGVPLECVRVLPAHTAKGPDQGLTAGSMSVFEAGPAVRTACAHARALFVEAAAAAWQLPPEDVAVTDGVIGSGDGRRTSYGALAGAVDLDDDVPTTAAAAQPPATARLVGTSAARLDLPAKIAGRPAFVADLRLPGQLFGRVVRPPSPGARLVDVDETVLAGADVQVVRDGSFLGVVVANEQAVTRAADVLREATTWTDGRELPDEADLTSYLKAGPHETIAVLDELLPGDTELTLTASYSRPFLAHASIAPSCGIARWEPDGTVTVWSSSQGIHRLRDAVAGALALDPESVVVQHVENAGCYGHNGADDAAFDAVLLARATPGRPVQVQWSRRDELTWAPFGSAMCSTVEGRVDAGGRLVGWAYDVWSQGHTARPGYAAVPGLLAGSHLEEPLSYPAADDPPVAAGGGSTRNSVPIYDVGARRITGHRLLETPVRSSALRALGAFLNVLSIESFLDEVAEKLGRDPYEYRLAHLTDDRARAVLETAAREAGWGDAVPDGRGRGIGLARYKERGAYCAVVAEVEAETDIRVRRLTVAVDVGAVVNPDGVRNQMEGGAIQAATWTLRERVRFDRRRITSDDWESYPILRFSEVPRVDVHLLDRPDLPSVGSGEAAQGPTAAALANAVAAAIGVRVRDLPLTTEAVVAAIEFDGQ